VVTPTADARFRVMYDATYQDVFAYCLRRSTLEDAKDAAADVYLVAWRRIDDMPPGDEALPWLYGTARKVMANQRRSRSRFGNLAAKIRSETPRQQVTPEAAVVRHEQDQAVLDALGNLRESDREVIRLAVWEELPHADIARILRCSDRAVTMRLHRAMKRLGRQMRHSAHLWPDISTHALAHETEAAHD
jgi:RNA polymerase sigma-70 factor (ECF subfamily)